MLARDPSNELSDSTDLIKYEWKTHVIVRFWTTSLSGGQPTSIPATDLT